MRGFRRELASGEQLRILSESLRLDGYGALVIVAYEVNLLHVAVQDHLFDAGPLNFLGTYALIAHQQVSDTDNQDEI